MKRSVKKLAPALAGITTLLFAQSGLAINTDPFDYVPAAPGTTLAAIYYSNNASSEQYAGGSKSATNSIKSDVGIARFVHYTEIGGFTVAPQILLPAVSVTVNGGGSGLSTSGISDPIIAAPFWFVNRPQERTYFAVTPYLHLPIGSYDRNQALNPGDNRWKLTIQPGLSLGLGEKFTFDLIGDVQFFADNNDLGGGGSLEQKPLFSIQPQITYQLGEGLTASLGGYHYWGGETKLRGIDQNDKTQTTTVLGTLAYWFTKKDNLQLQYRDDVSVENGAKTNGFQFRFIHVF